MNDAWSLFIHLFIHSFTFHIRPRPRCAGEIWKRSFFIITAHAKILAEKLSKKTELMNTQALHTAGAPEIWIDQLGLSRREILNCPDVNES